MFDFIKPDEGSDGQDGHIMIMQIHQGKSSQHKIVWGRFTMNRDVKRCPLGSTAMYVVHHFEVAQEKFAFYDNSNLFNHKLIIFSDTTSSLEKEISGRFYRTMLQKTCGEHCNVKNTDARVVTRAVQ
jgi:hypothetical protein